MESRKIDISKVLARYLLYLLEKDGNYILSSIEGLELPTEEWESFGDVVDEFESALRNYIDGSNRYKFVKPHHSMNPVLQSCVGRVGERTAVSTKGGKTEFLIKFDGDIESWWINEKRLEKVG